MKPENNATKKHKRIAIWSAVILAVALLGIVVWRYEDKEQEKRDAVYEMGYTFPAEVGFKIAIMDSRAAHRCAMMDLTQEECPQSTEDTFRRLLATMMTQQAERHGPGPYGKGYAPEYAVAINHMFYQFIQSLEGSPCQPMLYRYASETTLKALQEGEFIHRCDKGWRINSEWAELMERTTSIKPVGDAAMEQDVAIKCDGIFRNQLVFQRGASTADRMNVIVSQIQSQHSDCNSEVWNPVVIDLDNTTGNPAGKCFGATPGTLPAAATMPTIGSQVMPTSLGTAASATTHQARTTSGRDSENNILVYFSDTLSNRPFDGASCWLYYTRLKTWHHN